MLLQYVYVLLSLSAAMDTTASYSTSAIGKRGPTQHYCGNVMAEALKVICDSVYNPMFTNKRSKNGPSSLGGINQEMTEFAEYNIIPSERREDTLKPSARRGNLVRPTDMDAFAAAIQNLRYPFASKASSLTMLPRIGNNIRDKRGVYDECCMKSCSLNELATYCGQ